MSLQSYKSDGNAVTYHHEKIVPYIVPSNIMTTRVIVSGSYLGVDVFQLFCLVRFCPSNPFKDIAPLSTLKHGNVLLMHT